MGKQVLAVKNMTKTFGTVKALSEVSLDLHEGEVLSVIGENGAGKSTLMNVITGIYQPDKGQIFVNGQEQRFATPLDAIRNGISIVHQELVNCQNVTVAENIFMSTIIGGNERFLDYKSLNERAKKLLDVFECEIDPGEKMSRLSISEQQIVEIAKALSTDARIIIFDEPTSSLAEDEVKKLFRIIRRLKQDGIAILYISHRMNEIFELSDRVVILKDGTYVDTLPIEGLTQDIMVRKMTGRAVGEYCPPKADKIGRVIFEAEGYSKGKTFDQIKFVLHEGEILGFSGLVGAGRSEVMKAITGIEPCRGGSVKIGGKPHHFSRYSQSLKEGMVYLTEDRKAEGLFLRMDIQKNMSILNLDQISGKVLVDPSRERAEAEKYQKVMNVKCSGLHQLVGTLSGGNQQKVLIGNALSIQPKIIILDEPTRGVDVGAKAEIYRQLRKLAASGVGIIVVSSDLPEIIGLCDRVCIMYEGKLCGEVTGGDINEERILQIASGL